MSRIAHIYTLYSKIHSAGTGNFGTNFMSLLSCYVWDKVKAQWIKAAKILLNKVTFNTSGLVLHRS